MGAFGEPAMADNVSIADSMKPAERKETNMAAKSITSVPEKASGKRKTSKDWKPFAVRLAAVLQALKEDQFLVISQKR